jgi:flavin reductase (DIM6/NTAB) family NADH-FMN oxidoreductase RutF
MLEITNPVQTILVTSKHIITSQFSGDEQEKDDIITIDWHTLVNFEPAKYAIVIAKKHFSYKLIHESGIFVVNFISHKLEEAAKFCGNNSGIHLDKFEKTGLTKQNSDYVDCVKIKEAIAHLECEVEQEIDVGDNVIFIGKVLGRKLHKEDNRLFHTVHDLYTTTKD